MRAAIYIRVSTEEQAEDGLSLAAQEARCRARAEADGATSCVVFSDPGISGKTLDRPGLRALLETLGDYDRLYVYDLSRLSRDLLDQLTIERRLIAAGVTLVSLSDPIDHSTASGRMVGRVKGAVDQFEREQLAERVKLAMAQRASEGRWNGCPPFGYTWARDEAGRSLGYIVPDERAPLAASLFARYARGESLSELAQWLEAQGVRGVRGSACWRAGDLGDMLRSRTYIGQVAYAGAIYDGQHEAIVPVATWQRVQERLARRAQTHPRARDRSLSPLLRCAVCGGPVSLYVVRNAAGTAYDRYHCSARKRRPLADRHEPVSAPARGLEYALWTHMAELISGDTLQRALNHWIAAQRSADARDLRAELADRVAAIDDELRRNLAAYHAGGLPLDLLTATNAPLIAERERLRARLEAMAGSAEVDAMLLRDLRNLAASSVERLARSDDYDRKRAFLGRMFTVIELTGPQIVLHYRGEVLPARTLEVPRRVRM